MAEDAEAAALLERLRAEGGDVVVDRKVESATLRRIWRERCEEGLGMPDDLFDAGSIDKARVK
jgi:hypothetical protein